MKCYAMEQRWEINWEIPELNLQYKFKLRGTRFIAPFTSSLLSIYYHINYPWPAPIRPRSLVKRASVIKSGGHESNPTEVKGFFFTLCGLHFLSRIMLSEKLHLRSQHLNLHCKINSSITSAVWHSISCLLLQSVLLNLRKFLQNCHVKVAPYSSFKSD